MGSTFTISQTPNSSNLWLYPNSSSATQLTPVGETENYQCVDENRSVPDTTTYVYTDETPTITDIYGLPDHTTETGTINYVQVFARAKSHLYPQSSSGTYDILMRIGGVDFKNSEAPYGNDLQLSTGYSTYSCKWLSNPSSSVTWTWTDIDNLLVGVECSSPTISSVEQNTTFRPNGAGNMTELTPVGSASNYKCVDDVTPDDDTTYVKDGIIDASYYKDLYNFPNHTTETGTINQVTLFYRWRRIGSVSAYGGYTMQVYSSATYTGDEGLLPTDWATESTVFTSNPSTSSTWTWDDIDNLQAGVELKTNLGNPTGRVTQVYLTVNYTEDTSPEIRTTQVYAKVNYTPPSSTVTLNQPLNISGNTTQNMTTGDTWAGDRIVRINYRENKTLTITGRETVNADTVIGNLQTMVDNGAYITLAGLDDTSLNTDYWIRSFDYHETGGHGSHVYDYTLVLEEE